MKAPASSSSLLPKSTTGTCVPSEPVFVENPDAKNEDDGVLLVMVLADGENDYLSVLDAKNLNEIARAELPNEVRVTYSFHGFFADGYNFTKIEN